MSEGDPARGGGPVRLRTRKGELSVAFSPDGETLASSSRNDTIKLWDVATRKELPSFGPRTSKCGYLVFSPDGATLASEILGTGTITLWNVRARAGDDIRDKTPPRDFISFSPDGRTLAIGSDEHFSLFDLATGKERRSQGAAANVRFVGFLSDGEILAKQGDGVHKVTIPDNAADFHRA